MPRVAVTARPGFPLLVLATAVALGGCEGPLSALDPAGPNARAVAGLWWGMFGLFTLVFLVVVALWLVALRRDPGDADEVRSRRHGNRWIVGGGLLLPSLSITGLLLWGIPVGQGMLPLAEADREVLRVEVAARQWQWRVSYPDSGRSLDNELRIPAGTPVDVVVTSEDVVHSFWVPRLGGKMDAIPGRANVLRLEADEPGRYHGVCAEFCGQGHARMGFSVEVMTPGDFSAWLNPRNGVADD